MNNSSFVFKGYKKDILKGEAVFSYEIIKEAEKTSFSEKIYFPIVTDEIPPKLLKSILNNLMLILGVSYWKLYCPKEIVIESNFLNEKQADFWNIVYTKGLGEFFYKNKIDFRGLIKFPSAKSSTVRSPTKQNSEKTVSFPRKDRFLLGLGGGKDSIVAAEILKRQSKNFDLLTVGTSSIQENVASVMRKKPIVIRRELDPKLFELNKKGNVYNGHIPVSAIYAFLGLLTSVLYNYSHIVVGNEKSANYGNVTYLGEIINHQWSKSEEFEKLFAQYIKSFITSKISYSSMLRNMNEMEVTKEFVKYPKYFNVFSSCNTNFRILKQVQDDNQRKWCGKCAKCLFVFTLLAAFLSKEKVLDIFGKNLFEDESLLPLFEELLGVRSFKPFECVGTPEEMKEALTEIVKKKEFNNTKFINLFKKYEAKRT